MSTDPLCYVCRNLADLPHDFADWILKDFRLAKEAGCKVCTLVDTAISRIIPACHALDTARVWIDIQAGGALVVIFRLPPPDNNETVLEIYRVNSDENSFAELGVSHAISPNSTDQRTLARVNSWLDQCQTSHVECTRSPSTFMPKRLLEIGTAAADTRIRVCEDVPHGRDYVALSHCWGDPSRHELPLRLLSSNMFVFAQDIPWHALSKTFQDAVQFCRLLGKHYLWIDSLCILQDDQDWQEQTSQMADVYRHAYVTLSATAGVSGVDGLCCQRPGSLAVQPGIHVRKLVDHTPWETVRTSTTVVTEATSLPTLQRAWCMQERLLSSRILHFTHSELILECYETTFCECGYLPSLPGAIFDRPLWKRTYQRSSDWYSLLMRYTATDITKDGDRLPALTGLAATFSKRGLTYVAGLWHEELVFGLTWYHDTPTAADRVMDVPTFSWVRTPGPISYDAVHFDPSRLQYYAHVLDSHLPLTGGQSYIQSNTSFVKLKGHCVPISCYSGGSDLIGHTGAQFRFKVLLPDSEITCGRDGLVHPDVTGGFLLKTSFYGCHYGLSDRTSPPSLVSFL